MAGTDVDPLSLEEFHARLATRVGDAQAIITKLTTELAQTAPRLGTFDDGKTTSTNYRTIYTEQLARAQRLLSAVQATQEATGRILENYNTNEARNAANAEDIARHLGGLTAVVGEPVETPAAAPAPSGMHYV
jgi:ABC-type transporter Mla subunit MlaD